MRFNWLCTGPGQGARSGLAPHDEFLRQSINHGVSPADGASIVLSFRYFTEGEEHLYEICRAWQGSGEQIREELRIFKDGAWIPGYLIIGRNSSRN